MTGWTWVLVGSATAGTDVDDDPVVDVAPDPLDVDVLVEPDVEVVVDPEPEWVVDVVLCELGAGLLLHAARSKADSTGAAMRSRRTGEENRTRGAQHGRGCQCPRGVQSGITGSVGVMSPHAVHLGCVDLGASMTSR
jgi:hypothetical protein